MRLFWTTILALPLAVAIYACGGAQTPSTTASDGDTCPLVNAGPPPVCPEGCTWDGEVCRKHSGIIMPDVRVDGGGSAPWPTGNTPP
jgi:hypothetical protein